jgi:hypothetical protein
MSNTEFLHVGRAKAEKLKGTINIKNIIKTGYNRNITIEILQSIIQGKLKHSILTCIIHISIIFIKFIPPYINANQHF